MKLLKYILLFLFSLFLNSNVSAKEIVVIENQNTFLEVIHNQTISKEYTWLGLLYLQESSKLVSSNDKVSLSCQQNFSSAHRDLIDAWKVLDDAGVDDLVRKNIDEVEFVDDYIKTSNKTKIQVTSEINTQGYTAWKFAEAVDDVLELTVSAKNHIKYGDVKITIMNSQTGDIISQTTRKVTDPPINVPTTGVNVQFNVTGIHFEDILTPGLVEEVAGTRTLVTTLQDGTEVFQSKIKVWVSEANNGQGIWKVLGDEKTWWPSSWTEDKIWSQVSQAFNNKTNQYSNLYHGISNDGTKIALRLDDLGNIKTAYIIP